MPRHFLTDLDIVAEEQRDLLSLAASLKANRAQASQSLKGKTLGMLFDKSSTRTRASFEAGVYQMGGQAIFLPGRDNQMGRGESVADTAAVLSRYVDLMVMRTFAHDDLVTLADNSRVPVINGLDDLWHPCQALADMLTISETFGDVRGRHLVYVGDGNNMAHSLLSAGALAGCNVRVICPKEYAPNPSIVSRAQGAAQGAAQGCNIAVSHDMADARGADVIYTDVWASMGQEHEQKEREKAFAGFTITQEVMQHTRPGSIFLHCLPAHRGLEVTAEVIDGPNSRVFEQAENRLHVQKALMLMLLAIKPQ